MDNFYTDRVVRTRCKNMWRHTTLGEVNLPVPCDDCYSEIVVTLPLTLWQPPSRTPARVIIET